MAEQYQGNPQIVAKQLYSADLTSLYSKKSSIFPVDSIESAKKQMADIKPAQWLDHMGITMLSFILPDFARSLIVYRPEAAIGEIFLHSELGNVFSLPVKDKDIPKPGENLVVKKAPYLKHIQEESGHKRYHYRTAVDHRMFDFANKYQSFEEYAKYTAQITKAIAKGEARLLTQMTAAMLIGCCGGMVFSYEGTYLERLFSPSGKEIYPGEDYSKQANEYHKSDGEIVKDIKELAGTFCSGFKNNDNYSVNCLLDEIKQEPTEVVFKNNELADYFKSSSLQELKSKFKKMYLDEKGGKQYLKPVTRRRSLICLASAIKKKLRQFVEQSHPRNTIGFNPHNTNQRGADDIDFESQTTYDRISVYLNSDDLEDLKDLVGSEAEGLFYQGKSNVISSLTQKGVEFIGCEFFAPGCFLAIDKNAMRLVKYFSRQYQQDFPFDLVTSNFKHTFFRVSAFKNYCGCFVVPNEFSPNSAWLNLHLSEIAS